MIYVRALTTGLIITLVAAATATSTSVSAQTTAPGAYYVPPAWSQTLPASTRFIVLSNFDSGAVLDRETGLVWQRTPLAFQVSWNDAQHLCDRVATGGRRGWRLPTFYELSSLLDPTQFRPALPLNHPFQDLVQTEPDSYWTTTLDPSTPDFALAVEISSGVRLAYPKFALVYVWCVRGGSGGGRP
jgi:hypothetical protein